LQGEIQEYHREQLEEDGIFLPPREATVQTVFGNFTQKDLDKAAKKRTKKQSPRSNTIAAPTVEKSLDSNALSDAIAASTKPNCLTRSEALAIAKNFGFKGTSQNLYDWAKAALTAKSEESKQSAKEKLAAVGLAPTYSNEGTIAWLAIKPANQGEDNENS